MVSQINTVDTLKIVEQLGQSAQEMTKGIQEARQAGKAPPDSGESVEKKPSERNEESRDYYLKMSALAYAGTGGK